MSLHRSLKSSMSSKGHRNVLKRLERIKKLKQEERWAEENDSIYGLPKVRSIKVRAKTKTKATPEEQAAAGAEGAPPAPELSEKEKSK